MHYSILLSILISFGIFPLKMGGNDVKLRVACVGDSITYGARLEEREHDSYPVQLEKLLGEKYEVENFGVGGCTLIRKGRPTVWNELDKIEAYRPDIVVVSLGTNDTCGMGTCGNRKCWEYKDEYEKDYRDLIDKLASIPSKPRIWICAPSPMVLETPELSKERIDGLNIRKPRLQELITTIKKLSNEKEVEFIDLNTSLDHKPALFTIKDGVHPNKAGYLEIAKLVFQAIVE